MHARVYELFVPRYFKQSDILLAPAYRRMSLATAASTSAFAAATAACIAVAWLASTSAFAAATAASTAEAS